MRLDVGIRQHWSHLFDRFVVWSIHQTHALEGVQKILSWESIILGSTMRGSKEQAVYMTRTSHLASTKALTGILQRVLWRTWITIFESDYSL